MLNKSGPKANPPPSLQNGALSPCSTEILEPPCHLSLQGDSVPYQETHLEENLLRGDSTQLPALM